MVTPCVSGCLTSNIPDSCVVIEFSHFKLCFIGVIFCTSNAVMSLTAHFGIGWKSKSLAVCSNNHECSNFIVFVY